MLKPYFDSERAKRIRTAGGIILVLGGWLVLASLALEYGTVAAAVSNAVVGVLVAVLALPVLRNPFGSAAIGWLTAIAGLWLAAAPFALGYFEYTLSSANNVWVGLVVTLLSVFFIGEALQLHEPIAVHQEEDAGPVPTRAEPQD